MKKITVLRSTKRIATTAAKSIKGARRIPTPSYCKPDRLPYGTPGPSTINPRERLETK